MSLYRCVFRPEIAWRRLVPCLLGVAIQTCLNPGYASIKHLTVTTLLYFVPLSIIGYGVYGLLRGKAILSLRAQIIIGTILVWTAFYGMEISRRIIFSKTVPLDVGKFLLILVLSGIAVSAVDIFIKLRDNNASFVTLLKITRRDDKITRFVGAASNRFSNLLCFSFLPALLLLKSVFVFGHFEANSHWLYVIAVPCLVLLTYFALKTLMGKRRIEQMNDEVVTLPEDYVISEFI